MTDEVEALTEQEAMEHLRELAQWVPSDQAIVELGVYRGASLAYLAEGAKNGRGAPVYGVDPWGMEGAYPGRPHMLDRYVSNDLEVAKRHLAARGVDDGVTLIRDFSYAVGSEWEYEPVGLLFIDAVHREHEVMQDFYTWLPRLASPCVVCFDDHDERFDGVRRAVKTFVDRGELVWNKLVGSRMAVLIKP